MEGFQLTAPDGTTIRFLFYLQEAPLTCKSFAGLLPFSTVFFHARVSGQEIWFDNLPALDVIQENASVFVAPGEVVLGPSKPARLKTRNCFGIYYGEGKGLDACNIFAKVAEADLQKLQTLGNAIWQHGAQQLTLSRI